MKKCLLIILLLLYVFCNCAVLASACAEGLTEEAIPNFIGVWSTDGAHADIRYTNNTYYVLIRTNDGEDENVWAYTCQHSVENSIWGTGTLTCFENGNAIEEESFATFSIDNDKCLVWKRTMEDADDIVFQYTGTFEGTWKCNDITIDFYSAGGYLNCDILYQETGETKTEWHYWCDYDMTTGNAVCDHNGVKTVFTDPSAEHTTVIYETGSASFSINDDGQLNWNDNEENAGERMAFLRVNKSVTDSTNDIFHDFYGYQDESVMAFSLCACDSNVKNVHTHEVQSELYSQADIDSAIAIITKEFIVHWKGCALKEIYYAGDDISKAYQDWADRNDADEVIVLLSSFDVDSSGGDGSLNPNSTYTGWNWILVRSDKGTWEYVDHGY